MRLLGESVQKSADAVVNHLEEDGGIGGVIALDQKGNGQYRIILILVLTEFTAAFAINCSGMYRGIIRKDGIPLTAIFKDDILQ